MFIQALPHLDQRSGDRIYVVKVDGRRFTFIKEDNAYAFLAELFKSKDIEGLLKGRK